MTCSHVLGLIDAGPFTDAPRAHLEAARLHASQCATCGPAFEAARALTDGLAALPQVAPPPDLADAVLARVARIEEGVPSPAASPPQAAVRSIARDWRTWATAAGGLAAALAIVLWTPFAGASPIDFAARNPWATASLVPMPSTTTGTLVLAAGLLIYVAGLFSPVRDRRGR